MMDASAIAYSTEPIVSNFLPLASAHSPFRAAMLRSRTATPMAALKKKILLHPRLDVRTPPRNGPSAIAEYTVATFIPRALPVSPGGKTEVRIATDVPKIMAPPTPWTTLMTMRMRPLVENGMAIQPMTYTTVPRRNTPFLPCMSAILPIGTSTTADDKRYDVWI